MAMVKSLYQIADDCKDLRDEIHKTVKIKRSKTTQGEIASWVDNVLKLQADLAKKVDEVLERLVRLEDEVRKGMRPEMLRKARKAKK
jgi:hypothetical protein